MGDLVGFHARWQGARKRWQDAFFFSQIAGDGGASSGGLGADSLFRSFPLFFIPASFYILGLLHSKLTW